MSFSVCSSGPLCDFPRLSAARLMLSRAFSSTVTFRGSSFYGFAASLCSSLRLSRFFAVTFRGFAASLCSSLRLFRFFAVTFHGFAASLCSSLRLFRFFAVTRQGFDALHRDFPWLVFLWLCRLFMFLTAAFPVLCRDFSWLCCLFMFLTAAFPVLCRDFSWLCCLFMFLTAAFPVLCRDSPGFSSPCYSSSQHSGALHTTLRFFASRLSEAFKALQGFNRKLQKYNLNFIKLI